MPEIRIQYKYEGLIYSAEMEELTDLLRELCANEFSLEERPLTRKHFDVMPETMKPEGWMSHDIIIRITLHRDLERLQRADESAGKIRKAVIEHLNKNYQGAVPGRLDVAVGLNFCEIAWAGDN